MINAQNKKLFTAAAMILAAALALWLAAGRITPQAFLTWGAPMLAGAATLQEEASEVESGGDYISFDVLEVEKGVDDDIRIELIGTPSKPIALTGDAPQVLIYHTHTTEAFTPTEANPYKESSQWRTQDNDKNIVRVGEELAKQLRERYGINVLHDTTDHEPPQLGTSYERSLKTMEDYLEKYPSISLMIDLHRDAYTLPEGVENTDFAVVDGKRCARVMFVVGTGEGKTGAGFKIKPNYKQNYGLALAITEKLQAVNEKLARPIRVKTGRYNQHMGQNCLLIEMGHNANTLEEVLNSVPYVARAIAESSGWRQDGIEEQAGQEQPKPEALQFALSDLE